MELFVEEPIENTPGIDDNIIFTGRGCESTSSESDLTESEELSDSTVSRLDTTVTPFVSLRCIKVNIA